MHSKKLRNVFHALILLGIWICIVVILSSKASSGLGDISAFYFWTKLTSIIAGFGALLFVGLRIANAFDKNRNLAYSFMGVANTGLGLLGIAAYCLNAFNIIGLHDLLLNLLAGVLILTDIFLFETMFKKSPRQ